MKIALITGITGQDGSYMAELLLAKGYRVIGVVQDIKTAEKELPSSWIGQVPYVDWDMKSPQKIVDIISHYQPTELYNFAAYSSGIGMFDDPIERADVNGLAITRILEAIRKTDKHIRFCQASSREIFGDAKVSPQSEETPYYPCSPYGAAKLYAHTMVQIYRKHYGMFAVSAILFNHESPRRGFEFVTRRISREAVRIKLGRSSRLYVGNLDARRDWGYAPEYVEAMWQMIQQNNPDDFVIATGTTHTVR